MRLRQLIFLAISGTIILTLGACSTVEKVREQSNTLKTAKIMDKDKAQIAVTLNKNLSFDVLGVRAGKRVEPCKKGKSNDCHFDSNKIFAQETFTITIVEGSCCAYVSVSDATYEFCTPQWPLDFVNSISGESCPRSP